MRLGRSKEIPAIPKYIQEWESPFGPEAKAYPLQVIGHHSMARAHSTLEGVDWLEEAFPQRIFINPVDASARGISNGDAVSVFNDRGETRLRCRVTQTDHAGRRGDPAGRMVDAGRAGRRHARLDQRAHERAVDAAGVRQRAAHDHGRRQEDMRRSTASS